MFSREQRSFLAGISATSPSFHGHRNFDWSSFHLHWCCVWFYFVLCFLDGSCFFVCFGFVLFITTCFFLIEWDNFFLYDYYFSHMYNMYFNFWRVFLRFSILDVLSTLNGIFSLGFRFNIFLCINKVYKPHSCFLCIKF